MNTTNHPAARVACPRCGAQAGALCRAPSGRRISPPHLARIEAAAAAAARAHGSPALREALRTLLNLPTKSGGGAKSQEGAPPRGCAGCPNCGAAFYNGRHPEGTGCAVAMLAQVIDDRDEIPSEQVQQLILRCNVDRLWDHLGPIIDRMQEGFYNEHNEEATG